MIKRFIPLLLCLMIIFSFGGVYATWQYAEASPAPTLKGVGISISEFNYPPEEILPGGEGNGGEVELGENHLVLVRLIVDEAEKGYNLNNSNSIIHSLLEMDEQMHSNQKVTGGNLKFVLDAKNNTHKLYYSIEKASDTMYYIYTYTVDELATKGGTDMELTVYRTTVVKTNVWEATDSHLGYAKTVSLSSLGFSAVSQSSNYTIDVSTWHL